MKRKIHTWLMAVFLPVTIGTSLTGCSSEEPATDSPQTLEGSSSLYCSMTRSPEEAIEIAIQSLPILEGDNQSASRSMTRNIDLGRPVGVKTLPSPSRSGEIDTLYYVVNFAARQGFAIVAANRVVEPLLAITEAGSYEPEQETENLGYKSYLTHITEMLSSIAEDESTSFLPDPDLPEGDTPEGRCQWHEITCRTFIPSQHYKIPVMWGQTGIYGRYFGEDFNNNHTAGCTNVAMGQIMSYFKQPQSIQIDFDSIHSQTLPLDWDKISRHVSGNNCSCGNDSSYVHSTIGLLLRQLAKLNHSFPSSPTSTGTFTSMVAKQTMTALGYNCSDEEVFTDSLGVGMENTIYLMRGSAAINGTNAGHCWAADDHYRMEITTQRWWSYDSNPFEHYDETTTTQVFHLVHINWGWNGMFNGYFRWNILNPNRAEVYDLNLAISTSIQRFTNPTCWKITH